MDYAISCYQPLLPGPDMIRLLRLLPDEGGNAPIQCQLFNYTLQESGRRTHPYDALSYSWGDSVNPESIFIRGHQLPVTQNLFKALSSLRYRSIERILWVDAICINQHDQPEKERQIRFMAKIYAQANRVIVWLGEGADNSDQAIEEIRVAGGGKKSSNSSSPEMIQQAILPLLRRPWFRRIWVLQEVAAARHILIICGSAEIDGYAFCLGVGSLDLYNAGPELQSLIRSVTYLIKGAIFRPKYAMSRSDISSLDICPLGELIDMYHTREATKLHDKIFALLGMSSDDLSKTSLLPNYEVPWEELFHHLVKFLLYDKISVETLGHEQIVLIESKGCILGEISSVQSNITWGDSQGVDVISNTVSRQLGYEEGRSAHWTLHTSAKSIQNGDFVCLLQGASKPTIIRLHDSHFDIIVVAAMPPEEIFKLSQSRKPRNFALIWDWETPLGELQDPEQHETLLQKKDWEPEHSMIQFKGHLRKVTRTREVAIIFEDLKLYKKAEEKIQEAIEGYEIAAAEGHQATVQHLLVTGEVDVDSKYKDGATLLWLAAKGGHGTMIKLLLGTGKINAAGAGRERGWTALEAAAEGGHLAAIELLLQAKAEVDATGYRGRTALQAAAGGGHLTAVELLLQAKAEVNTAARYGGRTALQAAAGGGHLNVVERLLKEKAKVNAVAAREGGRTALQAAAEGAHLDVVERLLEEGAEVNPAAPGYGGRTALAIEECLRKLGGADK